MKTIFIVDDNDTNLMTAKYALEDLYRVYLLQSFDKMIALSRHVLPDLILLDIDMPEITGFEAMERLQSLPKFKAIPVIFLTASTDEANEVRGFELGAVDFISKPFSKPILLKRLETHIGIDAIVKQRTAEVEQSRADNDRLKNGIISVIADMVEGRDKSTGGHIDRTQKYLELLLDAMAETGEYSRQMSGWDLPIVLASAQLHDIGKITISDLVLNKPEKLTEEEFAVIKTHTSEGEKLIDKISEQVGIDNAAFLLHAKTFAGTHHERWDGTGYPRGLGGGGIPLEGRAMAIADVYDALTSERVYKPAFSHERAVEIIKGDGGVHFDPKLTEIFLGIENNFRLAHAERG
ncbi:two-component system response regulator [Clostridia bacterium]|nr:two-component system response regulator [Clostridia bacterium]